MQSASRNEVMSGIMATKSKLLPNNNLIASLRDATNKYPRMIDSDGVAFKITGQGYSFLQYIGFIPYAPNHNMNSGIS